MGYSTWLMDVIFDEFRSDRDVPVRAVSGWQRRGNSDADHAGVMDHHTGSRPGSRYAATLNYIVSGGAHPPWANVVTGSPYAPDLDNFPIDVVAAGQANHAGVGDLAWLDTNDGNDRTFGLEHYSTTDHVDWHPRHLEIQMRLAACLLEHMGQDWTRRSDHKEYALPAGRKSDRHHIDTGQWDIDLRDLMAARAQGGTDMPLTPEDLDAISKAILDAPIPHTDRVHGGDDAKITVRDTLSKTLANAGSANRAAKGIGDDVDGLRALVRAALEDAGAGATADQIVDKIVARLAN